MSSQTMITAHSGADGTPDNSLVFVRHALTLPVDALMFDFNDSRALQIPPDFSRQMPAMIPEAVQGRTSAASRFVGETDPAVTMRYNGPNPPDKDHEYYLHVWGTAKPLPGLNQGFWLNELQHAIRDCGETPDQGGIFLTGKA